jgi:hypothetical protein
MIAPPIAVRSVGFRPNSIDSIERVAAKAAGNPSDLSACFVGVSFFRSLEGDRLMTSVAQVFNERGEGIIVKGRRRSSTSAMTPHLSPADAHALLSRRSRCIARSTRQTRPASCCTRHRQSPQEEADGFNKAADDHQIDSVDLWSVRRSLSRLFREATYPLLRGTFFQLQKNSGLVYLRGSVKFFETYPGPYVPRPIEFTVHHGDTGLRQLAAEKMSFSKLTGTTRSSMAASRSRCVRRGLAWLARRYWLTGAARRDRGGSVNQLLLNCDEA